MPDGELTKITVCYDSGEDLYVHPYSAPKRWENIRLRVRWLNPEEFEPYPSHTQDLLWDTCGNWGWHVWRRLRHWFWIGPGRWAVSAISHFLYHSRWAWRHPPWSRPRDWRDWWLGWVDPDLMYPVLCRELYPGVLNLSGQLRVSDPGGLSETYYLAPSGKYIDQRLKQNHANWLERLGRGNLLKWEESDLEDLDKFLEWQESQEELGREVHYLVSLNT